MLSREQHFTSLVTLLSDHAVSYPNLTAYHYVGSDLSIIARLTYGELNSKAKAIAATLQKHHVAKGDRVILIYEPGLEFIGAFFGCLYAGVIAVPCYPPFNKKAADKLMVIIDNCSPKLILSTTEIASQIKKLKFITLLNKFPYLKLLFTRWKKKHEEVSKYDFDQYLWLTSNNIETSLEKKFHSVPVDQDDGAFLQYTSGSTSLPKGVFVSHTNLIHNIELISHAVKINNQDIIVSWLPVYHDMGLIGGLLVPIYNRVPAYIISPFEFLKNPLLWLKAMTKYQGTVSVSPNFGYAFCNDKIIDAEIATLNLTQWRVALNGAEPISVRVLQKFIDKFSSAGFKKDTFFPCYGLAESTLFVTGIFSIITRPYPKTPANQYTKNIISCGVIPEGLLIMNSTTCQPCLDNEIGEICLSGPCISKGYWSKDAENKIVAHDHVTTNGKRYIKTGDLGFAVDKQLFITGRIKDLIIIRGVNYYPQDIEDTVEAAIQDIRHGCCVAFSLNIGDEEKLAIVAEVKPHDNEHLANIIEAIKKVISHNHQLSVYSITLVTPKSIHKTTSGKVQRYANRNALLNHEFQPLASYKEK